MKKMFCAVLAAMLLMCGCSSGVAQEQYDAVVAERDAVVAERDALASEVAELKSTIGEYDAAIAEYNAYLDSLFSVTDTENVATREDNGFDVSAVSEQLAITQYAISDDWWNYHFVAVKNESEFTLEIFADVKFYDADGNIVGAETRSSEAVGPGVETVVVFMPDEPYKTAEVVVTPAKDQYYESVVQDLKYEASPAKNKEIVSITNTGTEPAKFVECYALFFNGDQCVDYSSQYFTDNDSELKPGKTITQELDCYEPYDSVKFFFSGRR